MNSKQRIDVLQDWVYTLCRTEQVDLLCAISDCDVANKRDASRAIIKGIRKVVLKWNPKDSENDEATIRYTDVKGFLENIGVYPFQFVMRVLSASQIIAYCHPNKNTRELFLSIYNKTADMIPMQRETVQEMRRKYEDYERIIFH